eukprot:6100742-Lingulodinium_polyedra.AAC.1
MPLAVSKRDARHFFHMLRLGRRWQKYLANLPIEDESGAEVYPLHVSVPMGMTTSAAWAQALTE